MKIREATSRLKAAGTEKARTNYGRHGVGKKMYGVPSTELKKLAKEIATVDFLSGGRMLPAVGLGTNNPGEFEAVGVNVKERAGRTDEAIALMRRLWTEDAVTFEGRYFKTTEATVLPKPVQKPCPPIWIGGRTDAAFRRVGRLGDGWLVAAMTPDEAGEGIRAIRGYAAEAGRAVPEDHYGAILSYCFADSQEEAMREAAPHFLRARSDVRPEECSALGTTEEIVASIERYVAQGVSKFVMRSACPPDQVMAQTERLAREIVPLFHKR